MGSVVNNVLACPPMRTHSQAKPACYMYVGTQGMRRVMCIVVIVGSHFLVCFCLTLENIGMFLYLYLHSRLRTAID